MSKVIGMSRNVNLEWLDKVASLYIYGKKGADTKRNLNEYLDFEIKSSINLRKTRSILTNIWVNEVIGSKEAKKMAITLFKTNKNENILLSHWCLMNFAYPVFTDVCRNIGRMYDNCNSITTKDVRNRMVEIWGERTTLIHSISKIVKTLKDIEVLSVLPKNTYGINKYKIENNEGLVLIAETIIYLKDKLYVSIDELNNSPEFFPFEYDISLDVLEDSKIFLIDKFGGELVVSRK